MNRKQFRHDFLRGLGSALYELKTCANPQKYCDIVRYGCLHNTTYDSQCEGDRGWYLHQSAVYVRDESIFSDVIERYSRSFTDHWFFNQLTSILFHHAKAGSEASRTALYDKYDFMLDKLSRIVVSKHRPICSDRDMFDWLCVWMTSLDGWSAFKTIVNDISKMLLPKDAEFFFSDWFYDNSKSKFGTNRVTGYLKKQAEKSAVVAAYWEKAQEWDNRSYKELPTPTLEDVISGAGDKNHRGCGISMRFCRNATPEDLERLFQSAMEVMDLQQRAELLWGFRRAIAPISEDIIFELLRSENDDIRNTALYIMKKNPSQKARDYALSLLQNGMDVDKAISLLSKNILPEDEQWFCDSVKSIPVKFSESNWHSVFMSAEDSIATLRGKPNTDLPYYLYRETFCSCCRERIVRLMHKKRVLTDTLVQECLYDSNSEIRNFAQRISGSKLKQQ